MRRFSAIVGGDRGRRLRVSGYAEMDAGVQRVLRGVEYACGCGQIIEWEIGS